MNEVDYEQAVSSFYEGLYAFAYSLAQNEADACELTQETFARLLVKGGQIRDPARLKSWLFTTTYRVFLAWKQREAQLPHIEISLAESELPSVTPEMVDALESEMIREALLQIDERYRAPLMLYYLEDMSYTEIAQTLDIPTGTVMSRLSRAKTFMREALAGKCARAQDKILPLQQTRIKKL